MLQKSPPQKKNIHLFQKHKPFQGHEVFFVVFPLCFEKVKTREGVRIQYKKNKAWKSDYQLFGPKTG